jgi:hypothetical protein
MAKGPDPSPFAAALGLDRVAISHVDDLGMCHSGNRAFLDLAAQGLVTCGSVMVPCPHPKIIAARSRLRSVDCRMANTTGNATTACPAAIQGRNPIVPRGSRGRSP